MILFLRLVWHHRQLQETSHGRVKQRVAAALVPAGDGKDHQNSDENETHKIAKGTDRRREHLV